MEERRTCHKKMDRNSFCPYLTYAYFGKWDEDTGEAYEEACCSLTGKHVHMINRQPIHCPFKPENQETIDLSNTRIIPAPKLVWYDGKNKRTNVLKAFFSTKIIISKGGLFMKKCDLKKRCCKLAKDECANIFDGLCLDPDLVCGNEPRCAVCSNSFSVHDGAIVCDYFLRSILPHVPELYQLVWAEINRQPDNLDGSTDEKQSIGTPQVKQCALCGRSFLPGSNRSKYCQTCREEKERKDAARRMQEYRVKKG